MDGEKEPRAAESSPDAPVCPSCGLKWPYHDGCQLRNGDFWRSDLQSRGWPDMEAPTCVGLRMALDLDLLFGPLDPSDPASIEVDRLTSFAKAWVPR